MHAHYDYLIIGGGIAGVTAAETIRQEDSDAHIAIVGQEPHVLYSRVLLPYYLKRHIARAKLFLRTAEDFTNKKIDIHQDFLKEVDAAHKTVTFESGKSLGYGKLLIATGGRVKEWGTPEDQHLIYRLQTLDDTDRLFEKIITIRNPIVIGSSFISLEFLEIFLANQIKPKLLVKDPYFFAHLIEERGAALMHANFERLGIEVDYDDTISRIETKPTGIEVSTVNSKKFPTDAIAVGIGIDRNISFAQAAGIKIGTHGIMANEFLETNQSDIFAAGDVAEYYDVITGTYRSAGNWTNAVLQGKRAGLNMIGKREVFKSVPSYSITNLGFQITALGDTSAEGGSVVRIDETHKQYARFFIKDGVLTGAVLINRFKDKAHLAKLIAERADISQFKEKLTDNLFDIHTISVVI